MSRNQLQNYKPTIDALLDRDSITLDFKKIEEQIKGKTILITGAAGFVGSEIAKQLLKYSPYSIILLDQAETPLFLTELELNKMADATTKIIAVLCDICQNKTVKAIFKKFKPHVVYHAAAYKHVPMLEANPHQAILVNVLGTKNILDAVHKHDVSVFVLISTDKAVNPSSIMGATKLIAERYMRALHATLLKTGSSKKYIITRFGNVIGSGGSVVPMWLSQIENGGPLTLTHPEMTRYFMTVSEACGLVLEAGAIGEGGGIYIFEMGRQINIKDLAQKMILLYSKPEDAIEIAVTGLRPGEKLSEQLVTDESTVLPTQNKSIMIAYEDVEDFNMLKVKVKMIISSAKKYNSEKMFDILYRLVPQIKNNNL